MPFDLVAFSEAAPGAGTVGIACAGNETLYSNQGDIIYLKADARLLIGLFYAAEATPAEARVWQPPGAPVLQFLRAVDLNDADPRPGYHHMFGRPYPLFPGRTEVRSVNAGDEDTIIALLLATQPFPFPQIQAIKPTHRVHAYADQALNANAWTTCALTYDQVLPPGKYVPVGMTVGSYISTGHMLGVARLLASSNANWRPGVPIMQAEGDKVQVMSALDLGCHKWPWMPELEFAYDQAPDIEMCSPAALTDHIVDFELVQTADWTKGR